MNSLRNQAVELLPYSTRNYQIYLLKSGIYCCLNAFLFDIFIDKKSLFMLKDSGHTNNKIVFDTEDYESNAEDVVKERVSLNISSVSSDVKLLGESDRKPVLFEDSSDDEEEGNFKIRTQFEGSKGQKVSI
jgi:hypothetical protein